MNDNLKLLLGTLVAGGIIYYIVQNNKKTSVVAATTAPVPPTTTYPITEQPVTSAAPLNNFGGKSNCSGCAKMTGTGGFFSNQKQKLNY